MMKSICELDDSSESNTRMACDTHTQTETTRELFVTIIAFPYCPRLVA